ncbi:MAG: serine/threonine-protein kinase [Gemmatimonadaceae bacterium]
MPERYLGRSLGRFRLDSVIGNGGFAWVYKGYDPELDIPVAVKVLKPHFAGDESFESRFRREASVAAKLRHPHIVRILAVGREHDAVYFVMDYLPQGLAEQLKVVGKLPESLLLRTGLDVADALAFAHRQQVIHRDIKVDNVLFDDHGNAIVADFGIARAAAGYVKQTGTNVVVGTPQYFSPEQARGQPLDGRADIYSLGVTLYRAATGELPFDGDDWYEIARRHVEDVPVKPRSLDGSISPEVERIILRCLAKDPAARYPTAEALGEALSEVAVARSDPSAVRTLEVPRYGGPPGGRGPSAQVLAAAAERRRRVALGAAGGALAIFAAALTFSRDSAGVRPSMAESVALDTLSAPRVVVAALPPADTPAASARIPARPSGGSIRIDAPAAATVRVDNAALPRARWTGLTLPPGRHTIFASVPAVEGCTSAQTTKSVAVAAGRITPVVVRPRECGYLGLVGLPPGARFRVTPESGEGAREGPVIAGEWLILPAGRYRIRVTREGCEPYEVEQTIAAGATKPRPKRIALSCPQR